MLAPVGCAQLSAPPADQPALATAPAEARPAPPAVAEPPAAAPPRADPPTVAEQWAAAFSKGDLDALTSLYDDDARLWGTSSSQLRKGPRAIREYYAQLL